MAVRAPARDTKGGPMTTAPDSAARPGLGSVVRAGVIAGLVAGILCAIIWLIAKLFGTDFMVSTAMSDQLRSVGLLAVILVPVLVGLVASTVAALLFRGVGAVLWVLLLGFALTLISLGLPLVQPSDVTWPTRLWLCLMHLVTGLVVVPVIALAVGGRNFALLSLRPRPAGTGTVVVEDVVISDVVISDDDQRGTV
jgi:hypothetical protein